MSLLSSTQGLPERVWSALNALDAHEGRLPRNALEGWLIPRLGRAREPISSSADGFSQTVGAATSLGYLVREDGDYVLGRQRPSNYAVFADEVHDRLCLTTPDDPDAVLLEVFAWMVQEVDARRSTAWTGTASNGFADAADVGIGGRADGQTERRFNSTKVAPWRRWMTFVGLAIELPRPLAFYPYVTARLLRELRRAGLPTGREIAIADVLDVVSRRMPYMDGGLFALAETARRGGAGGSRRLSMILSVALRDLHDEGRLQLRVRGDATGLRELSPDGNHPVSSVQSIEIQESADE